MLITLHLQYLNIHSQNLGLKKKVKNFENS